MEVQIKSQILLNQDVQQKVEGNKVEKTKGPMPEGRNT